MGILGAEAEAPNRAELELLLPDRCTVKRVGQPLTAGAWADTESDYATGVPCRVDKDGATDRELVVAGRLGAEESYVIMLSTVASRWPGGVVSVQPNDRLVVTGDGAGSYQPIGSGGPVSDELVRSIRCKKVV